MKTQEAADAKINLNKILINKLSRHIVETFKSRRFIICDELRRHKFNKNLMASPHLASDELPACSRARMCLTWTDQMCPLISLQFIVSRKMERINDIRLVIPPYAQLLLHDENCGSAVIHFYSLHRSPW